MKRWLTIAFADPRTRTWHVVDDALAVLTIISIISLVLETVPSLTSYRTLFLVVEWVAVVCFGLEYLGRLLVSQPRWRYPLSFFGVIDLVSILPTVLGLGTFLKSARALRIIRLLRMLRLTKVARSGGVNEDNFGVVGLNVLIYFCTLVLALLLTGTAMYLVEPTGAAFASIPAGMWWSLKVFMAGIPVATPETALGEFFFVLTRFTGLLLLGLLIGVVGNVFRLVLSGPSKSITK
jgi:voltage-gated potassium channel